MPKTPMIYMWPILIKFINIEIRKIHQLCRILKVVIISSLKCTKYLFCKNAQSFSTFFLYFRPLSDWMFILSVPYQRSLVKRYSVVLNMLIDFSVQ